MKQVIRSSLVVIRTYCPYWGRTLYELWDELLPIIPANNYLRSSLTLSASTIASKAYSLALFFRFLARKRLTFFDLNERSIEPYILKFRNELLLRARAGEFESSDLSEKLAEKEINPIGYLRAKAILAEVGWLCVWWGLATLKKYQPLRRRIKSQHDIRLLPDSFHIRIPSSGRRRGDNHALEPEEVDRVWDYVTRENRPHRPDILTRHTSRPSSNWPDRKIRTWNKAYQHYRVQLAWFHRQQMLWALMFGSAMRRSEVPLVMLLDLMFIGDDLWVTLRMRPSTASLGRAKTGGRTIFIGWDSRVRTAWENWTHSRQVLVDLWMAETGSQDHGMLLTNRDGGPLTVDGIDSLFVMLNVRFTSFGETFPGDQFHIHPHAVRHTVESLLSQRASENYAPSVQDFSCYSRFAVLEVRRDDGA
jgi:integrase